MATKTKKKRTKSKALTKGQKCTAIISIIMLCIAIAITIIAVHNSKPQAPIIDFNKDIAQGVDVSYHNGTINWDKLGKEVDFAIIRVGYRGYANGEIGIDKKAKQNFKNANKAGVPVGAYFFTQATTEQEAIDEAKLAISVLKDYNISLPVFIDYEYCTSKDGKDIGRLKDAKLSAKKATAVINAFCKTITDAGYNAGVYASSYIYKTHVKPSSFNRGTTIWVADYNEKVTYSGKYDIWQYTSKGKINGVKSKYVDKNYWYIKQENI